MALYVPLDVDYQMDPKIIAAGPLAECLFVRSLALSKRTMVDGKIEANQLPMLALGLPGPPKRHADQLVSVGLWTARASGWTITAWLKRNNSAAAITEKAETKKAASTKANHERWHTGEDGKKSTSCPLCYPSQIRSGVRTGQDSESQEKKAEPEEEKKAEEEPQPKENGGSRPDNLRSLRSVPVEDEYQEADRSTLILNEYVRLAVQACRDRGTPIRHMDGFVDDQRKRCVAKPGFLAYQRDYPTAPANAVACWLHGDKHSMRNYA